MNMSPLSSPVPFAVLQGKGDLESAPKQMPLEEAKLEKPPGSAHPPQTDKPRDGDFAAVLAAARPQAASANPIGKAPVAPLAQMTDEALATLVADANDLIATFQAESGTPDLAEMIASFVVSLQAFDAATGGEAMSVLAKNLGQLDASGLARLEAAALDTVSNYRNAVHLLRPASPNWAVPVDACSALAGTGIAEAWRHVEAYRKALGDSGEIAVRRKVQAQSWLWSEVAESLLEILRAHRDVKQLLPALERDVVEGRIVVAQAARRLLAAFLGPPAS